PLFFGVPLESCREASRSRPEGGGTPRRIRYTLRGSDDRERRDATLIGTALQTLGQSPLLDGMGPVRHADLSARLSGWKNLPGVAEPARIEGALHLQSERALHPRE